MPATAGFLLSDPERDRAAMRAGLEVGRQLLAWQSYEVRIVRIEQHDCYEQPSLPAERGADRR
jgi:hypothetical protein